MTAGLRALAEAIELLFFDVDHRGLTVMQARTDPVVGLRLIVQPEP